MGALRGDPSASHILFADAFDIAAAGVCAVKPPIEHAEVQRAARICSGR